MRKEPKQHPPYTSQQIKLWLSWLAWQMVQNNQTEFYIERMQADWIENSQQRHQYQRTVIRIVMSIQGIVSGALVAWLRGIAWIEHYTLRWYLWRAGSLPLHYVRFLNAASEYALLRRIGGGYIFTHRLVLEYFARFYQSRHNNLS